MASDASSPDGHLADLEIEIAQLRMENFALKQALEMADVTVETYGEWRVIREEGSI